MLYHVIDNINTLDKYKELIKSIDIHNIKCESCGSDSSFIFYGTYTRKYKTKDGMVKIKIQRIKCKNCNRTHAIIPKELIPYSQITLYDQISIILNHKDTMNNNPLIGESNVTYIKRNYIKYSIEDKLLLIGLNIYDNLMLIINKYFNKYLKVFMQTHKGKFINIPT